MMSRSTVAPQASGSVRAARVRAVTQRLRLMAPPWAGIAAVTLLAVGVRLALLARGVPPLDSDEAIVGLMARHLLHGEWSVFYWGQNYLGSLEPTLTALVFAVAGASSFTLRVVPLASSAIAVVQIYLLGLRLSSRRVALWTAAFCAVGTPFYVLWMLRARGGYSEMIVLGQAIVLLALRGPRPGWRGTAELGLFGLVVGLGLWTDPLVVSYLAAALLVLWLQGRLAWPLRPARLAVGLGGALLGLGPLLWPSPRLFLDQLVALAGHSALKGAGQPVSVGTWMMLQLARPISTALITGPVILGGWLGGVRGSNSSPAEFWRAAAQHPLLYAVALIFAFLAGAGIVGGSLRALRGARRRRAARRPIPPYLQAVLALATVALVGSVVFMAHYGDLWATPRYFLPVFSALPVSVAWWARVGPRLGRRLARPATIALASARLERLGLGTATARAPRLLVPAAGLALLLWNALALAALTPIGTAPLEHHQPVIGNDRAAIIALVTHGVRCARVDGYWMTYRLGFDSQERVIPIAVHGATLDPMNRYPPYLRDPACATHIGYVEMVGSAADASRAAEWRAGALPGYTRLVAGQFVVYVPAA